MARQLWMLRHGEAEPHGTRPDPQRRLTALGEEQSRAAGRAMAVLGVELAAVYASPKVRAWDTARLACKALDGVAPVEHEPIAGGFAADEALALALSEPDDARVMVVGHEPDFSAIVGDLTGARVDFKKGGIAVVRLGPGGAGELVALLRPRELTAITR